MQLFDKRVDGKYKEFVIRLLMDNDKSLKEYLEENCIVNTSGEFQDQFNYLNVIEESTDGVFIKFTIENPYEKNDFIFTIHILDIIKIYINKVTIKDLI